MKGNKPIKIPVKMSSYSRRIFETRRIIKTEIERIIRNDFFRAKNIRGQQHVIINLVRVCRL